MGTSSRAPLLVGGRDGATYDSVMADLSKLAKTYGGKFSDAVTRAVTCGLVIVYPDGKWVASGSVGRDPLANGVRLGIDRELG